MNNFSKLCKGEVVKNITIPKVIGTVAAIFILSLIMTILITALASLDDAFIGQPTRPVFENYESAIVFFEKTQKEFNDSALQLKEISKSKYNILEGQREYKLTFYKYLQENNLPLDTKIASPQNVLYNGTMESFSFSAALFSTILLVVIIICISLVAGSITNETHSGTIKLLFSRPVSKNKILTAKLFTILMYGTIVFVLTAIISLIVGAIMYKPVSNDFVMVFAKHAFTSSPVGIWAITLFDGLFLLFTMIMFASFIALITNSKSATLVITLVFLLAGSLITSITQNTVDWLNVPTVCSISQLFDLQSTNVSIGVRIFLMIFYNALFTGTSYLIFNHKEY